MMSDGSDPASATPAPSDPASRSVPSTEGTGGAAGSDPRPANGGSGPGESSSDRRRRGVRQLLFVVAGSHTGAFLGSALPTNFGLPGNISGVALVGVLFVLPFVVDAKWDRIESVAARVGL